MARTLLSILAGLVLIGFSASAASAATVARATTDVNMRAGPSASYPVVTVVPAGAAVRTYGCVADYSWCDVALGSYRGWVSANYLTIAYRGAPVAVTAAAAVRAGIVVVAYNRAYWDAHYVGYPWYRRWTTYPPYVAPRAATRSRAVRCVNGKCAVTRSVTRY